MSKQVRWQVPFVSRLGTAYRVDIYDEGYTGTPVQLLGGTSPFTTGEDDSDDYFAPIRIQTGTLTVCTHDEQGNVLITLDDILPANNIDRPVRLVNVGTGAIEWQGFLSCEAYDQDYTSIPQHLQLPVISVLEAMASVFINKYTLQPLGSIGSMLARTLNAQMQVFNGYDRVFFPRRSFDILKKYINTSALLSKEEYQSGDRMYYKLSGISLKKIIETICTYMGWRAREVEDDLYFEDIAGGDDMYEIYASVLIYFDGVENIPEGSILEADAVNRDMDATFADHWAGVDHRRTVSQGAHSVKVNANLEQFDMATEIPELPYGDLLPGKTTHIVPWWVFILPSADDKAYSNLTFRNFKATMQMPDADITIGAYSAAETADVIMASLAYAGELSPAYLTYYNPANSYVNYAGAFLARMQFDHQDYDEQHQSTQDGLYVSLFGGVWQQHTNYNYIFQMKGVQVFAAFEEGYINLRAAMKCLLNSLHVGTDYNMQLQASLRIGDYNWTGSEWSTSNQSHFFIDFNDECDGFEDNWEETMGIDEVKGLLIPISKEIHGEMVFCIYPETTKTYTTTKTPQIYGIFFSELSMSFIPLKSIKRTERSSNTYYAELPTNFRDDISIDTSLSSWLHNAPSPSLLFNPDGTPMQTIAYTEGGQDKSRRPEVDLLNRLAAYYGAARQRLNLIVEHPTAAPLPLLRLNGISPDTRKYLPLADSRDWQQDISTLTCFETPTPNNE